MNGCGVCMATFKWDGGEEYVRKIQILHDKSDKLLKAAVYDGANIMANAIRSAIEQHSDTGDLASSMALVPIRNDGGFVNTKVNFADYDRKGVPNAIKAAALESGTSRGQPKLRVITKAANGVRLQCESAMSAKVDQLISQTMEG